MCVVDPRNKKIGYFDSLGGRKVAVLRNIRRWVIDELLAKRSKIMEDSEWETVSHGTDVPQQNSISDCGIFVCKYADFLSRGANMNFSHIHMNYFRARMAHELIVGRIA